MAQNFDQNLHIFLSRAITYSSASGLILYTMSSPVVIVVKAMILPVLLLLFYAILSSIGTFVLSVLPNPTPDSVRRFLDSTGPKGLKLLPDVFRQKKFLAVGIVIIVLSFLCYIAIICFVLASLKALN